jgi:hypothetical protein
LGIGSAFAGGCRLLRLVEAARGPWPPPRGFRFSGHALRWRRCLLQGTASGCEPLNRDQDIRNFALHVGRRAVRAVTEQPRDFPHRLAGTLIGYAVNDDDGDAVSRAHRLICIDRLSAALPVKASRLFFSLPAMIQRRRFSGC